MTAAGAGAANARLVPEIGPSLGRLTDPPDGAARGPLGVTLDDLRLDLVTRVFELAAASRQFAAAGDPAGALHSLGRVAWLAVWDQTVAAAAARVTDAVNAALDRAAAESRFPAKRVHELRLTPDDSRAIAARLGSGAAGFITALDALESTVPAASASGARGHAGWRAWHDALGAAARRMESAWLALEATAAAEQARWHGEIVRVRAWRRPAWPLWLAAAVLLAATTYVGLVLGGYLPVPAPLRGLADFWWEPAVDLIGVGIDLVDLERVRRLLADKGEHAMARFFTDDERAYLATRPDPTGHAAARIAAKEAVYKALQTLPGARAVGWRDIEVTRDLEGRPAIRLHGLAAQLAEARGGVAIQVSLTHSGTAAGAVATATAIR